MRIFGIRFKELREEKKLSQLEISKYLNVSQSAVAKWEKFKTEPTATAIVTCANFFGVSTDYLLGLEDYTGAKITKSNQINDSFNNNNGSINFKM